MPSLRALATICALTALVSCNSSDTLDSAADPADIAPADDSDFDTAELHAGRVRVRYIRVPAGYTVTDMNGAGDLLLGNAWLPAGRWRPRSLPFTGRSINSRRQILGPGLSYFTHGRVVTPPSPCTPIVGNGFEWDCSGPVTFLAMADNGDILATYRQDATGTLFSPWRFLTAWRARTGTWETILFVFGDDTQMSGSISDHGSVVGRFDFPPGQVVVRVEPRDGDSYDPSLAGACPAPSPDATEVFPGAVNDAGELVGEVVCQVAGVFNGYGARWSRTGVATPIDGFAYLIDNAGNIAGRRSDGHIVVWLTNGTVVDLSSDPAASPRKFVGRGRIFGFIGARPVVWRFGY